MWESYYFALHENKKLCKIIRIRMQKLPEWKVFAQKKNKIQIESQYDR